MDMKARKDEIYGVWRMGYRYFSKEVEPTIKEKVRRS